MEKPEKVIVEKCRGFSAGDVVKQYDQRDVMLYALGVGLCSENATDPLELPFVYEHSEDFAALPTFATVLSDLNAILEQLGNCPGLPVFNPMMLLHGEQTVTLHQPLPLSATLRTLTTIRDVYDKEKGALVIVDISSRDKETGKLICTNETSVFIRGIGGFGGPRGPKTVTQSPPQRRPDAVFVRRTTINQALVYRLSGDFNPLHADPEMAALGNFERPILHGLCFFGVACQGIVQKFCENKPERLLSIKGRFTSSVIPGDTLEVRMWRSDSGRAGSQATASTDISNVVFSVMNVNSGKACIEGGYAVLRASSRL